MKPSRLGGTEKQSLWSRIKQIALTDVGALMRGLNADDLENMERVLIEADFGVPATVELTQALEDPAFYDEVTKSGLLEMVEHPDKIVVAGDSAGGYLTMKIAELATRRGLTPPAAVLTFSPLLSLDPDRDDKAIARVSRVRDAYIPVRRIALVRERWVGV